MVPQTHVSVQTENQELNTHTLTFILLTPFTPIGGHCGKRLRMWGYVTLTLVMGVLSVASWKLFGKPHQDEIRGAPASGCEQASPLASRGTDSRKVRARVRGEAHTARWGRS